MEKVIGLERELSGVGGKVSYRNFINGILNRQLTTKALRDMEYYIENLKHPITTVF
jgi:hypothetical protein